MFRVGLLIGVVGDDLCESYLNSLGAFFVKLKGFDKVLTVFQSFFGNGRNSSFFFPIEIMQFLPLDI